MKDAPFTAIVEYPASRTWAFKLKSRLRKLPLMGAVITWVTQNRVAQKYAFQVVDEKPFSKTA